MYVPRTAETALRRLAAAIYDRQLEASVWYANYVITYLERDVRNLLNVKDLGAFQRFVALCSGRTGQLLNLSALATECGITHNTAGAWVSVLEASYLVALLKPHHRNFNKRLVKTPKLYFLDPGLAAWLLGIQRAEMLSTHPSRGALFETWVVSEFLKARFNQGQPSNLYFWRDRSGHEVDLVLDEGVRLVPIEVKSGHTVTPDFFRGLRQWELISGDSSTRKWVVYGGDARQARSDAEVVPWREADAPARHS